MKHSHETLISQMTTDEKVAFLSGKALWKTTPFAHLGIPSATMTDGTYGVRYSSEQIDDDANWTISDFLNVVHQSADDQGEQKKGSEALFGQTLPATCFPNGSALACSWDTELVYQMGQALAHECQALGVDILLGPGINLRRTPLSGRGYEYYSEDPVVSGELAAALINGMQDEGVGASLKHFACNNSEFRRTEMDSIVDARTLHELYLAGFKRAIDKSNPWTVMSSYNRLNGEQTSQSHTLLTQILREQWGYNGLVMSDWYGIKDRPASLLAGNDLSMPEVQRDKRDLLAAINEGRVPMSVVDESCARLLTLLDRLQLDQKTTKPTTDFSAHHALAQQIAEESIVLLKNDEQTLPLDAKRFQRVAIIGPGAHEPVIQGSGCATTVPYVLDRPLDEIIDVAGDAFDIHFAKGVGADDQADDEALAQAVHIAQHSDVAVVFVNTAIGEDGENGDRQNLSILAAHEQLIHKVSQVAPRTVVVLSNSDAVEMPWLDQCHALLETFFAGQGVGKAVAKLLFGHANPSGKLTVTVPNCLEETPAFLHYPGEALRHHYSEGIYVGYRYYDKRKMTPRFPFGFGLSYTQFEYQALSLSHTTLAADDALTVSVTVTNSGDRAGKEVVQVYLTHPDGELAHAPVNLKAFSKVALAAGETQTVELTLSAEDFRSYHPTLEQWITEAGTYEICVGAHSRELPLRASVQALGTAHRLPLNVDSSLVQLINDERAFAQIVALVADKSGLAPEVIRERLINIAPELFCGFYIALTEFLGVDVSRQALADALHYD
ncbi:beta-glucosidase [Marinomonas ostreistagni]|uniref:beta-glucosidase n=1 Tax=Marinomonas ostreistagni TaxID=359209 RepID=UPI00194E22D8|nr:glycoside hydrolase family 3 C-terminal domain-containing protein [Marinomonas ostreistagni]MBM6551020.1 glycoside hydrolase family 3 C-terminal domain-containing protein [Marinomonas ostreistagni]